MRKIVACILLALQLAAVGFLVGKSCADEKAEAARVALLLREGEMYTLPLTSMYLDESGYRTLPDGVAAVPAYLGYDLGLDPYPYVENHAYVHFTVSRDGVLRDTGTVKTVGSDGLYLRFVRLQEAAYRLYDVLLLNGDLYTLWVDCLCSEEDSAWIYSDDRSGVFLFNGEPHTAYVRLRVLGTDVLFDGLVFDGVFYPFAERED